jgi:hypothetical protein
MQADRYQILVDAAAADEAIRLLDGIAAETDY